ncbi:MAG: hypothetical protein CM1200mP30_08890 [Pseudomonadota bacterium]|nr:MAG: hypothetical protein CM1200mP30_08890 [Pseudomonadota bacterium]
MQNQLFIGELFYPELFAGHFRHMETKLFHASWQCTRRSGYHVDLFGAAKIVNSRHFVPFESFITAGFFYLCLTFIIVSLFKKLEFRWYAHLRPREV